MIDQDNKNNKTSIQTRNDNKAKFKKDLLDPKSLIQLDKEKKELQHKIILENIDIYFPY